MVGIVNIVDESKKSRIMVRAYVDEEELARLVEWRKPSVIHSSGAQSFRVREFKSGDLRVSMVPAGRHTLLGSMITSSYAFPDLSQVILAEGLFVSAPAKVAT
jgi:hypothetical protein